MARRTRRELSEAERADWEAIARTITPIPKRAARPKIEKPASPALSAPRAKAQKKSTAPIAGAVHMVPSAPVSRVSVIRAAGVSPVEPNVLRAIKRGQLELDGRLDLHGETQASAYRRLEQFLQDQRRRGAKLVLVITGKGMPETESGGEPNRGVLKRALPMWLGAPPFAAWILGASPAGRAHGGGGAFYVVLRRAR